MAVSLRPHIIYIMATSITLTLAGRDSFVVSMFRFLMDARVFIQFSPFFITCLIQFLDLSFQNQNLIPFFFAIQFVS